MRNKHCFEMRSIKKARERMAVLKEKIMKQEPVCDEAKQLLRKLSHRLKNQSGKKQYGYLKRMTKLS